MRTFYDAFASINWQSAGALIAGRSSADVERALSHERRSIEDFAALISPAAKPYLARMIELSDAATRRRFGNTVQMYVPLYLSNECSNICTYCGFSLTNKIARITLSDDQIMREAAAIKAMGFDHVLLVTGESTSNVGMDYFRNALRLLRPHFSNIAMEVQPLESAEYAELAALGLHTVLVYQETYNEENYRLHHPKGKKSNFRFRLETPDRLGRAGVHKIGLGVLLGLENWAVDSFFAAMHLAYLRKRFWRTRFSFSFPRLRPAEGLIEPQVALSENELIQLICAFRLFDENLELSLSTRETAYFRDRAPRYGITSMSAGSRTEPGGYTAPRAALKQFEIDDDRSPAEVAQALRKNGFEVVWKDWDRAFHEAEFEQPRARAL